eukprot:3321315-Rhodomonas_salina.3
MMRTQTDAVPAVGPSARPSGTLDGMHMPCRKQKIGQSRTSQSKMTKDDRGDAALIHCMKATTLPMAWITGPKSEEMIIGMIERIER